MNRSKLTKEVLVVYGIIFSILFGLLTYFVLYPLENMNNPNVFVSGNTMVINGTTTIKILDNKTLAILQEHNRVMVDCALSSYCEDIVRQEFFVNVISIYMGIIILLSVAGYLVYIKVGKK